VTTTSPYRKLSKYLFHAAPPDMSESRPDGRWAFSVYEILDRRVSPVDPAVLHTTYRGSVELSEDEVPAPTDPHFAALLEETLVNKWKRLQSR
jgi:hypothetical protein